MYWWLYFDYTTIPDRFLNILRYTLSRCIQYQMMDQPKLHFWRVKKSEDPPRSKKSAAFRCGHGKLPQMIDNWSVSEGDDEERYGVLKANFWTLWKPLWAAVGNRGNHKRPFAKSAVQLNLSESFLNLIRKRWQEHKTNLQGARTPLASFHQPCRRKKVQTAHLGTKKMQMTMWQGAQTVWREKGQVMWGVILVWIMGDAGCSNLGIFKDQIFICRYCTYPNFPLKVGCSYLVPWVSKLAILIAKFASRRAVHQVRSVDLKLAWCLWWTTWSCKTTHGLKVTKL